ncbi:CWF19-like protein 2 [Lampris incognitus]|uniref:CWF19-like protein 2 n=1 Tax=Lampris incognitus TaxID=2546036 RepID=UPI0024B5DF87|nr:CWF19-like protein 2 [Lampris incognitus]
MAAYGGSFESVNSIEENKAFRRKARQEVLEKAKQQYEKEEKRKELKRQRGEDTWMLPEVNQRLQQIEQEASVKSKKKKDKKSKKHKKEKKKAKKHKKKAETEDGPSDSSEDSDEEWVESRPKMEAPKPWQISNEAKPTESSVNPDQKVQRDEWMTFDFLTMKTTSTTEKRAEKERLKEEERAKAQAIEEAGLHKLELNPYWKDGGSGLPPEEKADTTVKRVTVVEDGGLGWLRKSYQRMREQAEKEQRNLRDVVAERYGSMEQFQKRLAEAEKVACRQRTEAQGSGGWRKGKGEERERWRIRDGEGAERERSRTNESERDSSPKDKERHRDRREEEWEDKRNQDREQERSRDGDRYREWHRERDRDRERERNREKDRERDRDDDRDRDRDGDRDRERERNREKDRERDRDGDRERDRDRERERNREKDRERDRDGDRERDRDRGRYRDGERERDGDRPRAPSRPSWEPHRESFPPGRGQSLSLLSGSLKGRFLKPSEDDDSSGAAAPAKLSAGFLKPSSDDEGDQKISVPAWKKSSVPPKESHVPRKLEEESEKDAGNTPTNPQEAHSGDRATVASEKPRSESESEEEEEEEEEEVPLLTDEEMNKLGAKLVKAEIMGNTALIEKLKSQMECARKAKENHSARQKEREAAKSKQVPGCLQDEQEVILFRTDHSGRAWPVNAPSGPQEPRGGRRKKKLIETHVDGNRVRYFQDDDNVGLQEMVRREKMSSAQDQNALYSRMAARMMGKTDGDNYTLDDMFVSSAGQREGEGKEEERMRSRAMGEHRRLAASMEKCQHCFSSQELQKHLIVAIGSKVYLSLPGGVSMTEGHCLISPLQHHCSATGLDEDIWSEIQLFRRALVRTFESQDLDCVFMETHINPRRRQHMVLECIPLPRELGDMAPIYFKKAIMECDEEWANNKKVVDLSAKDVRKAIPRGLPYFAVDFGLQGGFAHVIENEHKFPHYFGKEIIGGMMDLEPRRWRKPIRENFDDQRKKVLQFSQWWKAFDCTKSDD